MTATVQVNDTGSTVSVSVTEATVGVGIPSAVTHSSIGGRTVADSHPASAITNTPAGGIAATTVQTALNELDADKSNTPIVVSGNFTAVNNGTYIAIATLTVTDPTPSVGANYIVHVRNGTATIGGVAYASGQDVHRVWHSGSWASTPMPSRAATVTASRLTEFDASGNLQNSAVQDSITGGVLSLTATLTANRAVTFPDAAFTVAGLSVAQTFSALQTFSNGLTVSAGTTAMQAATCTTLTASGLATAQRLTLSSNSGAYTASVTNADATAANGLYIQAGRTTDNALLIRNAADTTNLLRLTGSGALTIGTDPGGSDLLRVGGGVTCTTLTASGIVSQTIGSPAATPSWIGADSVRISQANNSIIQNHVGTTGGSVGYAMSVGSNRSSCSWDFDTAASAMRWWIGGTQYGSWTASGFAVGATALLASERLRVAGGTMGTPGATDVLIAAGKIYAGDTSATSIQTAGGVRSVSATAGIGYATGAGGAVTQTTSRTTGVTINTICGQITLVSAAGSPAWQFFTVTNSNVATTDTIIIHQSAGTDAYMVFVQRLNAGSFRVYFATTGGTTTEQPVFNFSIIKGVTA